MIFISSDFEDFKPLDPQFTCDGDNHSPLFAISDVPEKAKELILTCHDPDATRGTDFTHWIVTNIPPDTKEISSRKMPKGARVGESDFGAKEYGGPCPPEGSEPHRYIFSLYAVDMNLPSELASSREKILGVIPGHILAQSTWTGTYQRTSK